MAASKPTDKGQGGSDITPAFVLGGIKPPSERSRPKPRARGQDQVMRQVRDSLRRGSDEVTAVVREILTQESLRDASIWKCPYNCLPYYGEGGPEHEAECPWWERQED